MNNKIPSFKNIDTGNFIYGREIISALCEMEHRGEKSISTAGWILTREGEEDGEWGKIILIKVVV